MPKPLAALNHSRAALTIAVVVSLLLHGAVFWGLWEGPLGKQPESRDPAGPIAYLGYIQAESLTRSAISAAAARADRSQASGASGTPERGDQNASARRASDAYASVAVKAAPLAPTEALTATSLAPDLSQPEFSELTALPNAVPVQMVAALAEPRTEASPPESFPARVTIEYRLRSSVVDGLATIDWSSEGGRYRLESRMQATGFLASALLGVIRQSSEGALTTSGLEPTQFLVKRGDAEPDIAYFDRTTRTLRFERRNEGKPFPMGLETQDLLSFQFQLARIASTMAPGTQADVVVTNARRVYRLRFTHMGEETLRLPWGSSTTIRLVSDAAQPEDRYELWLSPQHHYLPVRLRVYVGKIQVDQIAASIATGIATSKGPSN